MRTILLSSFLITLVSAQDKAAIEKKLVSEYALTQATADYSDIVTAGAILVLKKGNIVMGPSSQTNVYQSTYKDGKISSNFAGKLGSGLSRFSRLPGASAPPSSTRTFVTGEKVWVTKIDVKEDGVVFDLFTDAYAEVRYKGALKFAFPKGSVPPVDVADRLVAEVFSVQPADNGGGNGAAAQQAPADQQQQAAPPPPAPDPAATAPIPPPPPPADEPQAPPKELKLGQTKDQVIANFGQPDKIVKLGAKEIYVYKDMKVTFVSGKVTDVQ